MSHVKTVCSLSIPPPHPFLTPHPPQPGGAVFINTGYAGGAYFIFRGNPTITQIWVAGHPVYLGNLTYSGALALRSGVQYFPSSGGAAKPARCV